MTSTTTTKKKPGRKPKTKTTQLNHSAVTPDIETRIKNLSSNTDKRAREIELLIEEQSVKLADASNSLFKITTDIQDLHLMLTNYNSYLKNGYLIQETVKQIREECEQMCENLTIKMVLCTLTAIFIILVFTFFMLN